MKFTIQGNEGSITVDVVRRNARDNSNYYDANWLTVQIDIIISGYKASFHGDLLSFEIEQLLSQIKAVREGSSQQISFASLEGLIHIDAQINQLGQIDWQCGTMYPIGSGAKLDFTLTSDQSYLPELITDLENILTAFPVLRVHDFDKA